MLFWLPNKPDNDTLLFAKLAACSTVIHLLIIGFLLRSSLEQSMRPVKIISSGASFALAPSVKKNHVAGSRREQKKKQPVKAAKKIDTTQSKSKKKSEKKQENRQPKGMPKPEKKVQAKQELKAVEKPKKQEELKQPEKQKITQTTSPVPEVVEVIEQEIVTQPMQAIALSPEQINDELAFLWEKTMQQQMLEKLEMPFIENREPLKITLFVDEAGKAKIVKESGCTVPAIKMAAHSLLLTFSYPVQMRGKERDFIF